MMKGRIQSQPLLIVQSTGGGKSMVPQTCGSAVPGVTIVIENTLALCADQVSKFDKLEAEGSHIFTIQLEDVVGEIAEVFNKVILQMIGVC